MKYFIYCRKSSESEDKQMQSIEDQEKILKNLAIQRGLEVIEILKESKSAKAPGRPVFGHMIEQIQKGKAKGIICWKLDRLARNPVDGGTINWMLQQGVIQKIVANDRDYQPTDNVLMMSVEFGMANQFILDLGKNAKRGMKSKCEKGWLPSVAPVGYLNNKYAEKGDKSILIDEERFPLVRKMWDLMLTGQYSLKKIANIANKEWGFKTVARKNRGGVPLSVSTIYGMFKNPFYYGEFYWDDELYKGKHKPMVTKDEFDHVQKIMGSKGRPRPKSREFSYTGLIRCGECGCMITAQQNTKFIKSTKKIKKYTYYGCTRKSREVKCSQKSIEVKKLELQIKSFLKTVTIEEEYIDWIIKYLHEFNDTESYDRNIIKDSLDKQLNDCIRRLDNLIALKINGDDFLTDEEFKVQKNKITEEKKLILDQLSNLSSRQNNWIESAEKAINFLRNVTQRFNEGSIKDKGFILYSLGSKLILKDGILSLQANGVYQPLQKGIIQSNEVIQRFKPTKGILKNTKSTLDEHFRFVWLSKKRNDITGKT